MAREAVIVSTARTGLAKSGRGGFNMTHGAALSGHTSNLPIARAGVPPGALGRQQPAPAYSPTLPT